MAAERTPPTAADIMVTALSPALIMALVGSLVFFLVEVLYAGDYTGKLQWTFFFFVFGAVLVSRIAIQSDAAKAAAYGLALGGATFLALMRFVDIPSGHPLAGVAWLVNLGLIGVIWWSANKLTWDCTFIDEERESSDAGLLEAAGFERPVADDPAGSAAGEPVAAEVVEEPADDRRGRRPPADREPGWWERYRRHRAEQAKKPHTPGLWVVYFSLAALPLFGLGQALIPAEAEDRRRYAFWLMVVYVGSGLGLLLATCFLGLRRYLRQRKMQMPAAMTGMWLTVGGGLIAAFLVVGALLPRPNAEVSVLELTPIGAKKRDASSYAMRGRDAGQGEGRGGEQASKDGKGDSAVSGNKAPPGKGEGNKDARSGEGRNQGQGQGSQGQGNQSRGGQNNERSNNPQDRKNDPDRKTDDRKDRDDGGQNRTEGERKGDPDQRKAEDKTERDGGKSGGESSPPKTSKPSSSWSMPGWLSTLFTALKWVVIVVLAVAVLAFILFRGLKWLANFTQWAKDLLAALQSLWNSLFGRRPAEETEPPPAESVPEQPRPRPFASFENPFTAGGPRRSAAELVRYSFAALEAWAYEAGQARRPEETPLEFAARLARETPPLDTEAQRLAGLYVRLAYAQSRALPADSPELVRQFWEQLEAVAASSV
jgi:hypothetical protein